MNTITIELKNGTKSTIKAMSAIDGKLNYKDLPVSIEELDDLIDALINESDKVCSFSATKDMGSFGCKTFIITSPRIKKDLNDSLLELSNSFDFSLLEKLPSFLEISGYFLLLNKEESLVKIENTGVFSSLTYCYKSDLSTKKTAISKEGFYEVPFVKDEIICIETNLGKQFLSI